MYIFRIKNIMGVEFAILPLTGTTVIGGYNSTQKSIIMKLAYTTIKSFKSCKNIQVDTVPKGSTGFDPSKAELIEGYGIELNSIDWDNARTNTMEKSQDKIQNLSKEFARAVTVEFYKTFGLDISSVLTLDSSLDIFYQSSNEEDPVVIFSISRSVLYCSWMYYSIGRNMLYLSSSSILDFYNSIRSGTYTGQDGNMPLSQSTVMYYDREMCNSIFKQSSNVDLPSWFEEFTEKKITDPLKSIDINEPLKVDSNGNVYILENKEYKPISLVGNGIRISSILTNLMTFNYLEGNRDFIFIDEPETGLNPALQNYLGCALGKAEYNTIMTTHSPYIVSSLVPYNTVYTITDKSKGDCSLILKNDHSELLKILSDPIIGV